MTPRKLTKIISETGFSIRNFTYSSFILNRFDHSISPNRKLHYILKKKIMKKYSWFLVLAFMAFACQLQNEKVDLSRASAADIEDYDVTAYSARGFTFTFDITINDGSKDISHLMFLFMACKEDFGYLDISHITQFQVRLEGGEWVDYLNDPELSELIKLGTGPGDECYNAELNQYFIKLDQGFDTNLEVRITLERKSSGGEVYVKAGNTQSGGGCFGPYLFDFDCASSACYEYKEETAWAAGTRYVTRGNWATFTPYAEGTVPVYAGQHHPAGAATFSAVVDGLVTITIELGEGWSLQEGDNSVKIQDYETPPSGNPSPGRFDHKGTSLTVVVPANNYYGIHLDVVKQIEVPCPCGCPNEGQ